MRRLARGWKGRVPEGQTVFRSTSEGLERPYLLLLFSFSFFSPPSGTRSAHDACRDGLHPTAALRERHAGRNSRG